MNVSNANPLELAAFVFGSLPPVLDAGQVPTDEWPIYVRSLVDEFGPQVVWDVALSATGFPATWVRGAGEAMVIESKIRELQQLQEQGKLQCRSMLT